MDKLEMAHEYAVAMLETPAQLTGMSDMDIAIAAFNLADAMQDEADKREVGIEELMKDHVHDYIYGRVCACGAINGAEKEWQPDWSQAPDGYNWWAMDGFSGVANCYKSEPFLDDDDTDEWNVVLSIATYREAPSFGYTGDWRESLRKRPE